MPQTHSPEPENLFGDGLTHRIYEILLKSKKALTINEITGLLTPVAANVAQITQLKSRVTRHVNAMLKANSLTSRKEYRTDLNTIIYRYFITVPKRAIKDAGSKVRHNK